MQTWDRHWKRQREPSPSGISWSKRRIIQILDRYVRPSMRVLDAGSGTGFFSNYFHGKGCSVTALDFSAEALAITRRLTNNDCQAYLQVDLTLPQTAIDLANQFDLIFTDGLLEHFTSDRQRLILSNFQRMSRAGGIIVSIVPNRFSWWQIVRPFIMRGIHEKPFTRQELIDLVGARSIIESGGISVLPISLSPDRLIGRDLGMLLYCVSSTDGDKRQQIH